MKSKIAQNLLIAAILACILVAVKNVSLLPWWAFIIPVIVFGLLSKLRNLRFPGFLVGFLTGFAVWFLADLYFDVTLSGGILQKLGNVLGVHKTVIMSMSGLIGGLLTGLALYSGYQLAGKPVAEAEKTVW